jgi:TetR/AcrR family transcriptional repressor of nem operon
VLSAVLKNNVRRADIRKKKLDIGTPLYKNIPTSWYIFIELMPTTVHYLPGEKPMPMKKGEKTKERIIRAATRLIHTRGYKNTSLFDIFAESGINKGSFYFHFSGKDELVNAVIDRFFGGIERRLAALFGGQGTALEKLSAYFDGMTYLMDQSGCTGGCLLGNLTLEVSDWHEELRNHLSACFGRMEELLVGVIAEGQRSGQLRTDRTAGELASFVIALMEGALMLARVRKDTAPLRALSCDAVAFLKAGS